jgi:hypothetical protein
VIEIRAAPVDVAPARVEDHGVALGAR